MLENSYTGPSLEDSPRWPRQPRITARELALMAGAAVAAALTAAAIVAMILI